MFLYIVIVVMLDTLLRRQSFWTEWRQVFSEYNLFLVSARTQFWFINAVSKYLKIASRSENVLITFNLVILSRIPLIERLQEY